MRRYFFHLLDHTDKLLDPEGRTIEDPALIPQLALREARWIVSQDALSGAVDLNQLIEVRDEAGELVHRLSLRDAVTFS